MNKTITVNHFEISLIETPILVSISIKNALIINHQSPCLEIDDILDIIVSANKDAIVIWPQHTTFPITSEGFIIMNPHDQDCPIVPYSG